MILSLKIRAISRLFQVRQSNRCPVKANISSPNGERGERVGEEGRGRTRTMTGYFHRRKSVANSPSKTEATMRTGDTRQRIVDKQKLPPPGDVMQTRKRRKLPRIFTQSSISHARLARRWVWTSLVRTSFTRFNSAIFSSSIVFSSPPPASVLAFARTIATF